MPDPKKFLFDRNIFDEPEVEEEDNSPPPPPTFSEEEMEAARASAYDKGRRDGMAAEKASRDTEVSGLLKTIAATLPDLFAAEARREKLYEKEAVTLALSALRILFPALEARQGLAEVESVLREVLANAQGRTEIAIDLHPGAVEPIEAHLSSLAERLEGVRVTVRADDRLGPGDCKMIWKDGGAVRDAGRLAEEIARRMDESLAGTTVNRHNEEGSGNGES
jgi:flagellar assembly protein FliH